MGPTFKHSEALFQQHAMTRRIAIAVVALDCFPRPCVRRSSWLIPGSFGGGPTPDRPEVSLKHRPISKVRMRFDCAVSIG